MGQHPHPSTPISVCACVIVSTPTLIDSRCLCLIMLWVFFPGTKRNAAVQRLEWRLLHVGVEVCPEIWSLNVNR